MNLALKGLRYHGKADFNGEDWIHFAANDGGFSGAGGAFNSSASIRIELTPMSDVPLLQISKTTKFLEIDEDEAAVIHEIVVGHVDVPDAMLEFACSAKHGVVSRGMVFPSVTNGHGHYIIGLLVDCGS